MKRRAGHKNQAIIEKNYLYKHKMPDNEIFYYNI